MSAIKEPEFQQIPKATIENFFEDMAIVTNEILEANKDSITICEWIQTHKN